MGRLAATLLVLCFMSLTTAAHDLWRGVLGRLLAYAPAGGGVTVPIHWSQAFYTVNFTIGTLAPPPQPVSAVVDVGGELVWTQCSRYCHRCFKQDLPLFDTNASSTFRPEPCGTALCESIPTRRNCSSDGGVCGYEASTLLWDTTGRVGTDTVAIGTGTARRRASPSGRTKQSLVAQMNATAFSYCLAPPDAGKSSRLFIGATAKLAGGGSATTPFFKESSPNSGLNRSYVDLKKALTAAVGAPAPAQPNYDLCFPKAGGSKAPDLVFTFHGGAAMTVPVSSYLFDAGNDTVCLAIVNLTESDGLSILGSLQQVNIHFLFDLEKETLSFEHADCSALS
uniref:Peptidase A1 domain-containing protein n=1 Tax=Oryza brachyantha TaxID=4533 RepID=J3N4H0_ORYBR